MVFQLIIHSCSKGRICSDLGCEARRPPRLVTIPWAITINSFVEQRDRYFGLVTSPLRVPTRILRKLIRLFLRSHRVSTQRSLLVTLESNCNGYAPDPMQWERVYIVHAVVLTKRVSRPQSLKSKGDPPNLLLLRMEKALPRRSRWSTATSPLQLAGIISAATPLMSDRVDDGRRSVR